jgi:hypothetical protein
VLYLKRPKQEGVGCGAVYGRFGYSGLKEVAFVRGGRYGISIDFGLEVVWKEEYLWADRQSGAHLFSHDAKAPDGLIVTRDTSFFKTCCHLILQALLLPYC